MYVLSTYSIRDVNNDLTTKAISYQTPSGSVVIDLYFNENKLYVKTIDYTPEMLDLNRIMHEGCDQLLEMCYSTS